MTDVSSVVVRTTSVALKTSRMLIQRSQNLIFMSTTILLVGDDHDNAACILPIAYAANILLVGQGRKAKTVVNHAEGEIFHVTPRSRKRFSTASVAPAIQRVLCSSIKLSHAFLMYFRFDIFHHIAPSKRVGRGMRHGWDVAVVATDILGTNAFHH